MKQKTHIELDIALLACENVIEEHRLLGLWLGATTTVGSLSRHPEWLVSLELPQ
jgi:hypothetical protein